MFTSNYRELANSSAVKSTEGRYVSVGNGNQVSHPEDEAILWKLTHKYI
jgi:hypothetical protein